MSEVLTRLTASAERIQALQEEIAAERQRRDQLIRQALDQRATYKEVARAARRSAARCAAITGQR